MVRGAGLCGRHRSQLAPGELAAGRDSFGEVVLVGRLREVIRRMNPAATVKEYFSVQSNEPNP